MKTAVGQMFAADGRSFVAGKNSGGRQETYRCSGHTVGCKAQVRAYKGADGVWKVHTIDAAHTDCSGGNTKGRTVALQHLASTAVKDHSSMNGKELKRKLERNTGINVAHRTANRMKMTARDGDKATTAAGYQLLVFFCDLLQQQCPGSVAETQINNGIIGSEKTTCMSTIS
ncbi:unnamed protein product [Ectocarpus sp. CCAP 1310/34]|nr:unnamed protein product [Ectocarpus sp. CCAP 1310/34]